MTEGRPLVPEAHELIMCQDDSSYICDTFLFEPSPGEELQGFLYIAAQTQRGAGSSELLSAIVSAIQKEYYREPKRSPVTSLEMALHQANLILHDTAQQGTRDWMGYFHVAVGALAKGEFHLSVAGGAQVLLIRNSKLTDISEGLAHFPISNPLQTFSQLASGQVASGDTILIASTRADALFRHTDMVRAALQHSAKTFSRQLEHLYSDFGHNQPLSQITICLLPQYALQAAQKKRTNQPYRARSNMPSGAQLSPRTPLSVRRSKLQTIVLIVTKAMSGTFSLLRSYIWPALKQGSAHGRAAITQVSAATGKRVKHLAERGNTESAKATITRLRELPARLPRSSKLFALVAIILVVALATSLLLLQRKRVEDQSIQRASEILHEARTKTSAAETALIYDNREQASSLLEEAKVLSEQLSATGLYVQESQELSQTITTQLDRLQRITRAQASSIRTVGDFTQLISGKKPSTLFMIDNALYTINPDNNAVVKMGQDGITQIVQQTTSGIGFISQGSTNTPDKTITLATTPAGIAIFDAKDATLVRQDISFAEEKSEIDSIDVFGNRLYLHDSTTKEIYAYNKTLRGFSSPTPWITDATIAKDTIRDIAVDGNIFTLHTDGTIHRLFKGELADFVQERTDPGLASATEIITTGDMQYLFVIDPPNKRVVIFEKSGALVKQIYIDAAESINAVAIHPDEDRLYVLDGTKTLEISLAE